MNQNFKKEELLELHLKNGVIAKGRFYRMSPIEPAKMTLCEVREFPSNIFYDAHNYFEPEIRRIVRLKDDEPGEQTILKISEEEYEDIIKTSKNYVYINQVNDTFQKAIEDLHQYEYIALSTDGASMGRFYKMPFLVVASAKKIYIFDIQLMEYKAFDAGLKKILESKRPQKIVHDCRKLADCLYRKHNIKLNSVFDTQVGDLIITKSKTGRIATNVKPLAEALNTYLGLQDFTIEEKLDLVLCAERPLSVAIKESLAKNICFLNRLSDKIHAQMMLPFYRGVECYLESLRNFDHLNACELGSKQDQTPEDFKSAIE